MGSRNPHSYALQSWGLLGHVTAENPTSPHPAHMKILPEPENEAYRAFRIPTFRYPVYQEVAVKTPLILVGPALLAN